MKPNDLIRNILTDAKVQIAQEFDRNFERKGFFKTKNAVIDVIVTLQWDNWFDTRCQSLMNLPELIKKSYYISSKKIVQSDYSKVQWVKKKKVKEYHFFEVDNLFQFDIEERWDRQITLHNIKVLK